MQLCMWFLLQKHCHVTCLLREHRFFFPCLPGIKLSVLHTNSSWVWIIFPLEATVSQRRILTQRRDYKKRFWKKWNKFGNLTMLNRQAEHSGLINIIFTNERVVMVKIFASSGGS